MQIQLLFWVLYLIALVFSLWSTGIGNPKLWGGNLLLFVLIGILGWATFGAAVHK